MTICRFYLENRCRFGENCRFEHPSGGAQRNLFGGPSRDNWSGGGGSGGGGGGGSQVTFRDSFGTGGQVGDNPFKWTANQQQNHGGGPTQPSAPLDIVNNLPKEMETWEKSRMWPFSCMSLEKDLPSLPEFQDVSMEEMRFEAYQAIQSGNLQPYTQKYQSLMNEFQNKRAQLKHMTMDLKGKLVAIIEEGRKKRLDQQGQAGAASVFSGPKPSGGPFGQGQSVSGSGLFGQQNSSSIGGTGGGGLFGKSTPSLSSFGGSSPISGSTFGSNPAMAASTTASGFGSSGGSLFGKPAGSVFGAAAQTQAPTTTNLFGSSFQTSSPVTQSVFGGTTNPSQQTSPGMFGGAAPTSNLFSSPTAATTSAPQGLFGKPAASTFGQTGNTPSLFSHNSSASPATALFSSTPTTGLFGKGPPVQGQGFVTPGAQHTTGLFGKGPPIQSLSTQISATGTSVTLSGSGANPGLYTPLADLTEAEKQAFNAKSFEEGKIPIRPPPVEMIH